jgi:hypothetical protein
LHVILPADLHVIGLMRGIGGPFFKAVNLVKTVNLAARFFMVVADLPAKLQEVLQAELPASLPAIFSWSRHPSHFLMSVAQTSFASARNSRRYEALWA